MTTATAHTRYDEAAIEADATVPIIHIWRDFAATPEQLFRAHTDPDLLPRWIYLAVGGLTLITLAATYERRRRDVTRLRAAVGRMG